MSKQFMVRQKIAEKPIVTRSLSRNYMINSENDKAGFRVVGKSGLIPKIMSRPE